MTGARERRAWKVAGAAFVMLAFSSGLGFYSQSVLLDALTAERAFSVASASLATSIFFAVNGLCGLAVAALIERYDARWTISASCLVCALSLVLIGRVETVPQLYAVFVLFGAGFAGVSMITGTTLVTRWFESRRAIALALASTGLSIGGILLTPLCAQLIGRLGLHRATPWIALILIVGIIPITTALVRSRPPAPTEATSVTPGADAASTLQDSTPFERAVRSRFFYGLTATYVFGLAAQVGGLAHQFKLVNSRSSAETATLAVSLLAGASIVGRLAAGWIAHHTSLRALTMALLAGQAAALTLLGRAETGLGLLAASVCLGLTVGSFLLMQPLLLADAFGVRDYARLFSISGLVSAAGVSAGPALIGWVHDLGDGYRTALLAAAGASLLGLLSLWLAGPARSAT